MVKIVAIHKLDAYYGIRKQFIGRTGILKNFGQCPRAKNFLTALFSSRDKKLGKFNYYFYAVKVEKITRKRREDGD